MLLCCRLRRLIEMKFIGKTCNMNSLLQRTRGLAFCKRHERVAVFRNCKSVHTLTMLFALDIAFLSSSGEVLAAYKKVRPMRVLFNNNSSIVVERFAQSNKSWLEPGDKVKILDDRIEVFHEH